MICLSPFYWYVAGLPFTNYTPILALTNHDLCLSPDVAGFMSFIADRFAARAVLFPGSDEGFKTLSSAKIKGSHFVLTFRLETRAK